jgi:hypothetical protein
MSRKEGQSIASQRDESQPSPKSTPYENGCLFVESLWPYNAFWLGMILLNAVMEIHGFTAPL